MNERLEKAVEIARSLSSQEQDDLASAMMTLMEFAGERREDPYILTLEDRAAIRLSREEADRGEFATDADVETVFAKYIR